MARKTPRKPRVGPWNEVDRQVPPNPLAALWGGAHSPTILYLEDQVREIRKHPDGSVEHRTRREVIFTKDARELGTDAQAMAVAVSVLLQVLTSSMRQAHAEEIWTARLNEERKQRRAKKKGRPA